MDKECFEMKMTKEDLVSKLESALSESYGFGVNTRYVKLEDALKVIEGLEEEISRINDSNHFLNESMKNLISKSSCYVNPEEYRIIRKSETERGKYIVPEFYYRINWLYETTLDSYFGIIQGSWKENEDLRKRLDHFNSFGEFIEVENPIITYRPVDLTRAPNPHIDINSFLVSKKGFEFIKKLNDEIEELKKDNDKLIEKIPSLEEEIKRLKKKVNRLIGVGELKKKRTSIVRIK